MRIYLLALVSLLSLTSRAAVLNIDPAQSHITLSGTLGGSPLREQAAGSLTTTFGGTVTVTTTGGQIQVDAAAIDPNVNGDWAPGRNGQPASPADLAGEATPLGFTASGALRDLLVGATSTPKPLGSDGVFDASTIVFAFGENSSSVLDYDSFLTGKGSKALAGAGTNQTATVGSFIENSGVQQLSIKIDATFYFTVAFENDTQLRLQGQLNASSAPGGTGPGFSGIKIIDGQIVITVGGASGSARLQSSTDLVHWADVQVTPTPDGSSSTYKLPAAGPFQFFRVVE